VQQNTKQTLYFPECVTGDWTLASHCRSLGSIPGNFVWDSWWMRWHWSRISLGFSYLPC